MAIAFVMDAHAHRNCNGTFITSWMACSEEIICVSEDERSFFLSF
jgi:hypothetical protein